VSRRSFEELARSLPNPVQLAEDGEPWPADGVPAETTFYLSDHHDFLPSEADALVRAGARRISLGEMSLHSHHCITVAHWLMDRR
jgi:tRNA (pseudouridine54-N1)-methyltransferase